MAELEKFSMLVGGKAVGALSGKTFQSQNPYTGRRGPRSPTAGRRTSTPPSRPPGPRWTASGAPPPGSPAPR